MAVEYWPYDFSLSTTITFLNAHQLIAHFFFVSSLILLNLLFSYYILNPIKNAPKGA